MEPRDVFISHVEEDWPTARALAVALRAQQLTVWTYEEEGIPGISHLEQSSRAIESCRAFVLLASGKSVKAHQVIREVEEAHEANKVIIPVRLGLTHEEFIGSNRILRMACGTAVTLAADDEKHFEVARRIQSAIQFAHRAQRPTESTHLHTSSAGYDIVTTAVSPITVAQEATSDETILGQLAKSAMVLVTKVASSSPWFVIGVGTMIQMTAAIIWFVSDVYAARNYDAPHNPLPLWMFYRILAHLAIVLCQLAFVSLLKNWSDCSDESLRPSARRYLVANCVAIVLFAAASLHRVMTGHYVDVFSAVFYVAPFLLIWFGVRRMLAGSRVSVQ